MRISDRLTGLLAEAATENTHFLHAFKYMDKDRKKAMNKYLELFLQGKEEKALINGSKVYPGIQIDCPTYDFISMYGIHPLAAEIIYQELQDHITTGFFIIDSYKDINGQSAIYKKKQEITEEETWQILFENNLEWYSGGKIFIKTGPLLETTVSAMVGMKLRDVMDHSIFNKYDFIVQDASFGCLKPLRTREFLCISVNKPDILDAEEMISNWKN